MLGKNLDDYQDDLSCEYQYSNSYSVACIKAAKELLKDFIKRHKETTETWEEELTKKGIARL